MSASAKLGRAKRVKTLRKMTNLSRARFEEETGIPIGTQQHWESEKENILGRGLTEEGAERLLKGCKRLGVQATIEWLMYGRGTSPKIVGEAKLIEEIYRTPQTVKGQSGWMQEELDVFYRSNPEAVSMIVPDNSMEPRFIEGEYVAGNQRYKAAIITAVGQDCITVTEQGRILLRYLRAGDILGRYHLICTNYSTVFHNLYNVKLISAAPVIWARRREIYS